MTLRCEVRATVKLFQTFHVEVDDPDDDEKIDHVLFPEWESRMNEMVSCLPHGDDWSMKDWALVRKDVI